MSEVSEMESRRFAMQSELDEQKSHLARNKLGQFSTPFPLALDIMRRAKELRGEVSASFLEPAFGTGVFLSACIEAFGRTPKRVLGFELDPHYCTPAQKFWHGTVAEIRCADFLAQKPDELFDLLVTNPPYSRHHHIPTDVKANLGAAVLAETGIKISGLAGLYCHFLMLSTKWLKPGGLSCWLIPCEFMDVNYGSAVRRYLAENVELVQIHRFKPEDLQFADALVSSCVVVFRNQRPAAAHRVLFTTGGSVCCPCETRKVPVASLIADEKWTPHFAAKVAARQKTATLGDYFTVKRGIATGDNNFFILDAESAERHGIPRRFLRPILPSPRYVKTDRIGNENGMPDLSHREFLFTCDLDEETLKADYPTVWQYIREGRERGVHNGYICSRRKPWYSCEKRATAPIVVPYMGRGTADGRLFRFILNDSDAITTNVYLMLYPKRHFAARLKDRTVLNAVWHSLNEIPPETLVSSGRTYGGGLHKLEPRELMRTPANVEVFGATGAFSQPSLF
ncbi:MAG: SAM-dependent DNA methyltransferase [Kiritimatiellae bacterium]|nr:SAM-dependent DNA methyltransferase [Kiritimatiellia bacterium]